MTRFHSRFCSFSSRVQKTDGGGGVDEGVIAINDIVDVHHIIDCVEDERSNAASALKPLGEIVAQDAGAGQDLSCLGKVERLAELHSYRSAGAAVLQNHADGAEHVGHTLGAPRRGEPVH